MTTYFSSGFETGNFDEWDQITSPPPTISSIIKYAGNYSLSRTGDLWFDLGVKQPLVGLPSVYWIHGRVRIDAITIVGTGGRANFLGTIIPNTGWWFGSYGHQFAIRKQADNSYRLGLWDDDQYIWYDGGITLTLGVWYDIDMKVTRAYDPDGEVKLYVNNSLIATASGTNTQSASAVYAGCWGTTGYQGQDSITCYIDNVEVNENSQLNPIGYSGGKIVIGINSLESPYILDVSMEQSCNVALRDVPLKSLGEIMDTGTYIIHTLTLRFSMRLSDADKTTLETIFTSHAEATIYLENENADYWTFTGWFRDKDIVYEYEKNRPWKVTFIFDIYSYSYSGASVGTFTNSQLRLVGGTTLDFEDIIDISVGEETSVAIPNWVNQSPTIDTNVWNKKLKRVIYTVRETEYRLYQLLQMLTTASTITFYDYIHGPTNKTAWLISVRADWNPVKKENLGSFVNAPWEVEFEVIVQN